MLHFLQRIPTLQADSTNIITLKDVLIIDSILN